jgi:hypothetical protein
VELKTEVICMNEDALKDGSKTKTRPPGFGLGLVLAAVFFVAFMMLGLGGAIGGALAGGLGMGIGMIVGKTFVSNGSSST